MKTATKKFNGGPADKELMEFVIKAACEYFDIEEDELHNGVVTSITAIRYMCFYLILNSSNLKDYMVAERFKKARTTVRYGMVQVQWEVDNPNIYRQTLNTLRGIATMANKFDKKYSWQIQQLQNHLQ